MVALVQKITGKHTETINITNYALKWVVTKNAEIHVENGSAILENGTTDRTIVIAGTLRTDNGGSMSLLGYNDVVTITKTAHLFGPAQVEGTSYEMTNDGTIRSSSNYGTMVFESASGMFENNGKIINTVANGFILLDDDVTLVNGKHGQIIGETAGVWSGSDDVVFLKNHGKIEGGTYSFRGATSADIITNKGTMIGDISLGQGTDSVDTRGGRINGVITGGLDDDTLVTSNAKYKLIEEVGGGDYDAVGATVSYKLNANVEILHLLGKKDINATGNTGSNVLLGNDGDNKIKGGGEGAAHDTLTGAGGNDQFIFTRDDGTYTITDFQNGHDKIGFVGFDTIDKFSDISGRISQQGDDVLISVAGVFAQILLEDTDLAQIDRHDFFFG